MLITENVWSNIQCFNLKNKQNIWTVLPVHVWPTCGPRQMFRELHWLKAAEGQAVWRHAQSQKITVTNQTSITYTSPLFGGLCLCWRNAFIKNKKWNSFSFFFVHVAENWVTGCQTPSEHFIKWFFFLKQPCWIIHYPKKLNPVKSWSHVGANHSVAKKTYTSSRKKKILKMNLCEISSQTSRAF